MCTVEAYFTDTRGQFSWSLTKPTKISSFKISNNSVPFGLTRRYVTTVGSIICVFGSQIIKKRALKYVQIVIFPFFLAFLCFQLLNITDQL